MTTKCVMCKRVTMSGRKHKPTGDVICDCGSCWSEWFIENTTHWGRM